MRLAMLPQDQAVSYTATKSLRDFETYFETHADRHIMLPSG